MGGRGGKKLKAERLFAELHKIGRKDCRVLTLTLSLALSLGSANVMQTIQYTLCTVLTLVTDVKSGKILIV